MAPSSTYRVEILGPQHERAKFSSGSDPLDRYLLTQAGQDAKRRVATCFVLVATGLDKIMGYYTLSATSIALIDLPREITKKLPRYPVVPAALMGRLAVDQSLHGQRLGEYLLMDAFNRCLRSEIASFAFVVDTKDDRAAAFYEGYGFRPLTARRLFLPMNEIAALFT